MSRHHLHENTLQKVVYSVQKNSGLNKRVSCHTFRHSYATQLLRDGVNIREVQALLGHARVSTTMIYLHVIQNDVKAVKSPLEAMGENGFV